jgi:hypothetical protein
MQSVGQNCHSGTCFAAMVADKMMFRIGLPGRSESVGPPMAQTPSMDRAWISSELVKGIEAERSLAADARSRADSPPDPALSVLYHEIAEADDRHAAIVEAIAVRYGHTPSKSAGGGIGSRSCRGGVSDLKIGCGMAADKGLPRPMLTRFRSPPGSARRRIRRGL